MATPAHEVKTWKNLPFWTSARCSETTQLYILRRQPKTTRNSAWPNQASSFMASNSAPSNSVQETNQSRRRVVEVVVISGEKHLMRRNATNKKAIKCNGKGVGGRSFFKIFTILLDVNYGFWFSVHKRALNDPWCNGACLDNKNNHWTMFQSCLCHKKKKRRRHNRIGTNAHIQTRIFKYLLLQPENISGWLYEMF